jgi:concanavalin A-like lectin/glucanase superfamily protein
MGDTLWSFRRGDYGAFGGVTLKTKLLATAVLAAMISYATSENANAATLIHEYTFNGDATDSVGSIDGTLLNGATAFGGILSLNGINQSVLLSGFAVPTGAFSVTFEAKSAGQNSGYTEIISQGVSGAGFYIGTDPTGRFRLGDSITFTGVSYPYDNQFHSFALVSGGAGGSTKFYIDSSLVFSSVIGITAPTSGTPTIFGTQFQGIPEFFTGEIKDIRIYSGELAPTPLPAALPLFAGGLGVIGLLARRRKQKSL